MLMLLGHRNIMIKLLNKKNFEVLLSSFYLNCHDYIYTDPAY